MEKNYGVMKSVKVSGDDAILAGCFDSRKSLEENLKDYSRIINESIARIKERFERKYSGKIA